MTETALSAGKSPSKAVWIVAWLISPSLPFFLLRRAGAIGWMECLCGFFTALIINLGLIGVLSATDGDPLQPFINLLLGLSIYIIVLWQFLAGQRAGLWTTQALKEWRLAGRFFGTFLVIALILNLVLFFFKGR